MAAHIHMDQQTKSQYSPNPHVFLQLLYLQSLGKGWNWLCLYFIIYRCPGLNLPSAQQSSTWEN